MPASPAAARSVGSTIVLKRGDDPVPWPVRAIAVSRAPNRDSERLRNQQVEQTSSALSQRARTRSIVCVNAPAFEEMRLKALGKSRSGAFFKRGGACCRPRRYVSDRRTPVRPPFGGCRFSDLQKVRRCDENTTQPGGGFSDLHPAGRCLPLVIFDRAKPVANPAISAVARKRNNPTIGICRDGLLRIE